VSFAPVTAMTAVPILPRCRRRADTGEKPGGTRDNAPRKNGTPDHCGHAPVRPGDDNRSGTQKKTRRPRIRRVTDGAWRTS